MRELLHRLVTGLDGEAFVDESLDVLVALLDADRGIVALGDPSAGGHVVGARRQGRDLTLVEREEVSKSAMIAAARKGRCVVELVGGAESMATLGIRRAMSVPLRGRASAGAELLGVLYLDFRQETAIGDLHREFLESAAVLIASALEPRDRLIAAADARRRERDAALERGGGPDLDEMLAPPSMDAIRREVRSVVLGQSQVLILGETGTGKTRFATAIAHASGRTPVVRATLGASDDLNTITSELFGHERGAFSGAVAKRRGLVEFADGGTLVLDEVLNLPPHAQQLLLDFTQFGTFRPLGHQGGEPRRASVRIIAATNGDLEEAIRQGRFRQDLYYRLSAFPIVLPPLRDRRADIPSLAAAYLRRLDPARDFRVGVAARRLLLSPDLEWRGNIRELEALVQRARERALADDPEARVIRPEHLEPREETRRALRSPAAGAAPATHAIGFHIDEDDLPDSMERLTAEKAHMDTLERRLIALALRRHDGVVAHAARALGVPRTSLISRMKTLGVDRDEPGG